MRLDQFVRYSIAAILCGVAVITLGELLSFHWSILISYPFYVLLYVFIALVAFGVFGRVFGLSNLFWHEHRNTQFEAGMGVALLLILMAVVSYEVLRDHSGDRYFDDMREFRDAAPLNTLTEWIGQDWWMVDLWELDRQRGRQLEALFEREMVGRSVNNEQDLTKVRISAVEKFKTQHPERVYDLGVEALRNRSLLFYLSFVLPWTGLLFLPVVLRGTWLSRCLTKRLRPSAKAMRLGANDGLPFVAGAVSVLLAGGVVAMIFPHLTSWMFDNILAFERLSDSKNVSLFGMKLKSSPRLFAQIMASQFVIGLILGMLILWYRRPGPYARVTPPTSLCLILAMLALIYGIFAHLAFMHPLVQFVAAIGIAGLILSQNRSAFKLRFPEMTIEGEGDYYRSVHRVAVKDSYTEVTESGRQVLTISGRSSSGDVSSMIESEPAGGLLDSETVLERWRAVASSPSTGTTGGKPKLAVVTTSGGSIRAAVWTSKVLTTLEREIPGFPYHLRLVTGASGGMLGAALYVADLDRPGTDGWSARPEDRRRGAIDGLPSDSLTAVARCMALRDLPGIISRGPMRTDRGRALEEVWGESSGGVLTRPFRELAEGEAEGWRPSLVFSPMLVEDGRRLLISNLDLDHMTINRGSFLVDDSSRLIPSEFRRDPSEDMYSRSAYQFHRLFPEASRFRLSTAVRMSATFPFISPAVSLPTRPPRRVVDAGYYDNYGINAAAMWVFHHRDWLQANTSGVVMIQVRAFESPRAIDPPDHGRGDRQWQNGLRFVTSPMRGVMQARQSVMSYRNDEQLEMLSDWFHAHGGRPDFFQTVSFECPASASLSWHITAEERQEILDCFEPAGPSQSSRINLDRLEVLKRWWADKQATAGGPSRLDTEEGSDADGSDRAATAIGVGRREG